MKIFIHSCHASLEYDQVRMFLGMGHAVVGHFDVASTQRPRIPGVTDRSIPVTQISKATLAGADVVILHQCENFHLRALHYAALGVPVIVMAFGQGGNEQHAFIAKQAREGLPVHVAAYSATDYHRYRGLGLTDRQVTLLHFSKRQEDYRVWTGQWPVIYIACNSIFRRGADGTACQWPMIQKLMQEFPVVLSGIETELVGGLGEVSPAAQRNLLAQARVFLAQGTVPAAYTLGLVEACMAGTPVVASDNGYGIAHEGFDIEVGRGYGDVAQLCRRLLDNHDYARMRSAASQRTAAVYFDENNNKQKWEELLHAVTPNHAAGRSRDPAGPATGSQPVDGSGGDPDTADGCAPVAATSGLGDRDESRPHGS